MSLAARLRHEAEVLAVTLRNEMADTALEKLEIESKPTNSNKARLAWLDKQLQAGVAASRRLAEYNPVDHKRVTCPYCWMLEGKTIILIPVQGTVEAVSCGNCSAGYALDD